MSRCNIVVQKSDGTVVEIICHSGGTVEENGVDLLNHYNTQELAEALVEPGNLSYIAAKCTKPQGHSFNTPVEGYCVYYGRDDDRDDELGEIYDNIDGVLPVRGETFLWMNGMWWWPDHNRRDEPLIPLTRALGLDFS